MCWFRRHRSRLGRMRWILHSAVVAYETRSKKYRSWSSVWDLKSDESFVFVLFEPREPYLCWVWASCPRENSFERRVT